MTSLYNAARAAHANGLCVIPVATNGTKQPWPDGPSWKRYQGERPILAQLDEWFSGGRYDGFGIVCGAISGRLEMFEFEGRAVAEGVMREFEEIADASGLGDLWNKVTSGYLEATPTGGRHVLWRVEGVVAGNTRLARRPSTPQEFAEHKAKRQASIDAVQDPAGRARQQEALDRIVRLEQVPQVLIETRGERGFVVVAPSAGRTHGDIPDGAWILLAGGPQTITTITAEERDALHHLAGALDQMPPVEEEVARRFAPPLSYDGNGSLRPGDDYNNRADWDEIITPRGWKELYSSRGVRYWCRPGKNLGVSATTGRNGADNLYVFSTSTEFEAEKPYSKFAAYTLITAGAVNPSTCSAAGKALRAQGYGSQPAREAAHATTQAHTAAVSNPDDWSSEALQEQDEAATRAAYEREVAFEMRRLRVRDDAARRLRQERAAAQEEPALVLLDEFLAIEDEPTRYRIEGLWPVGGRVLPAAQYKAGKTTLRDNLVRALVDGEKFLDTFSVNPPRGRIVLIDNELDERMLRLWLREQRIVNTNRIAVLSLRGKVGTFDILDPDTRARWASKIRSVDGSIVILDCLRPVFDALGLDENRDAGRFLVALDTLLNEAGAEEACVIHHMGHVGERSRGDSRLLDWPDVSWRLVREKVEEGETDPSAPRYFSAYGRDVNVPEGLLEFDPVERRLRLVGGSRRDGKVVEVLPVLYDYLRAHPGASKNSIEKVLVPQGYVQKDVRKALASVVSAGKVDVAKGARNSDLHTLAVGLSKDDFVSSSAPRQRGHSDFVSSSIDDELKSRSDPAPPSDEVTPRTKDGDLGQCQVCGGAMVILTPGQTRHPMC